MSLLFYIFSVNNLTILSHEECEAFNNIGSELSRSHTWENYPTETHELMLKWDDLFRIACPAYLRQISSE